MTWMLLLIRLSDFWLIASRPGAEMAKTDSPSTAALEGRAGRAVAFTAIERAQQDSPYPAGFALPAPFTFSTVRIPAMPSIPDRMTHSASVSSIGGAFIASGIQP